MRTMCHGVRRARTDTYEAVHTRQFNQGSTRPSPAARSTERGTHGEINFDIRSESTTSSRPTTCWPTCLPIPRSPSGRSRISGRRDGNGECHRVGPPQERRPRARSPIELTRRPLPPSSGKARLRPQGYPARCLTKIRSATSTSATSKVSAKADSASCSPKPVDEFPTTTGRQPGHHGDGSIRSEKEHSPVASPAAPAPGLTPTCTGRLAQLFLDRKS